MKRNIALFVLVLLLFVAQGALLRRPFTRADVATLVVVYLALERAVLSGAAFAMVIGYVGDIFAGTERGLIALTMVILFFAVRLLVARFSGGRFLFVTTVAVGSTMFSMLVCVAIEGVVGADRVSFAAISPAFGPTVLSSAALGYPCYRLFRALDERFKEPEDDFVFKG